MRKNKWVVAVLITSLAFTITACGNDKTVYDTTEDTSSVVSVQTEEKQGNVLTIAEQGIFSAGGTVIQSDGTFDVSNYYMSREGSTSHDGPCKCTISDSCRRTDCYDFSSWLWAVQNELDD